MKNNAQKLLNKYNIDFEELKRIMRLQDWEIILQETKEEGITGSVCTTLRRNISTIQINVYNIKDKKDLVDTIFHEMLHIKHERLDNIFFNLTENFDSKTLKEITDNQYEELMEQYIDDMSRVLTFLYLNGKEEIDENENNN